MQGGLDTNQRATRPQTRCQWPKGTHWPPRSQSKQAGSLVHNPMLQQATTNCAMWGPMWGQCLSCTNAQQPPLPQPMGSPPLTHGWPLHWGGAPMLPIPLWPACSCLWGHWLDCHSHCMHLFGRGVVGQPMVDAGRDELQLGITLGQSASPKVHPLIRSPPLPLPSLTPQFENSLHRSWNKGIKIEKIARTMKSKANFFDY